ncbi:MAG: bifunctional phosphopantothenoylcysteine decarboxylase/phosphopantothenate--cysteine ligase CoaBC [Candidatus Sericytochromatia bacterium]|nr:bifunctional phosphopantothenoylcysteine decarboxylase/phosphopantothenate--cysteine ligase CoaBC [Candidatus Sericytochromatia bacterium]
MAKLLLGVGAGIAAYKAVELVRQLQQLGHAVRVMMTPRATHFVGPMTFAGITGEMPSIDLFDAVQPVMTHIELSRWADLLILAPATADILGKLAHGLADDLLSTQALAFRGPVLVAAAMNTAMWEHPAVQANVATLQARGVRFILGESGILACGDVGAGRLAEPAAIAAAADRILAPQDLDGVRILVTAGGTIAPIDPVRHIGNPSTGRMGLAIAESARRRGATVTLVACHTAWTQLGEFDLSGVTIARVTTTDELLAAVLPAMGETDVLVAAAAPADYALAAPSPHKLKKTAETLTLTLIPAPDVLAAVGAQRRKDQLLIGFAAETQDHLTHGRDKLHRKHLDAIVINDVGRSDIGFGASANEVVWLARDAEPESLPKADKRQVADWLLDRVAGLWDVRQVPAAAAG